MATRKKRVKMRAKVSGVMSFFGSFGRWSGLSIVFQV